MIIYLLRHGDCRLDTVHRYLGQTNLPLNDAGRKQCREWKNFFIKQSFERIITSDLLRAEQTVTEIFGNKRKKVMKCPSFREASLGDWDGLPIEEIKHKFPGEYKRRGKDLASYSPPNGENFRDLQDRVVPAFKRICTEISSSGRILIVTHVGVIRVLLAYIFNMPLEKIFTLAIDYAGLSVIEKTPRGWVVKGINIIPHFISR